MEALIAVLVLVAIDVLAVRYGADTRDGRDSKPRCPAL
jgi:hypothetical protein